jgi:hypothetical protein
MNYYRLQHKLSGSAIELFNNSNSWSTIILYRSTYMKVKVTSMQFKRNDTTQTVSVFDWDQ